MKSIVKVSIPVLALFALNVFAVPYEASTDAKNKAFSANYNNANPSAYEFSRSSSPADLRANYINANANYINANVEDSNPAIKHHVFSK